METEYKLKPPIANQIYAWEYYLVLETGEFSMMNFPLEIPDLIDAMGYIRDGRSLRIHLWDSVEEYIQDNYLLYESIKGRDLTLYYLKFDDEEEMDLVKGLFEQDNFDRESLTLIAPYMSKLQIEKYSWLPNGNWWHTPTA